MLDVAVPDRRSLWPTLNARTTVYARKLIVARVRAGHRPGEVAKQLRISRQTVHMGVRRFRTEGAAGLADRSSRPHRMPLTTSPETVASIVTARTEHHAAPVRLAAIVGSRPPSSEWCRPAPACRGWPRSTGSPASCCAAGGTATAGMNGPGPASCCASTS